MKTQQALSDEQERLRIEGLRALARIIARRALRSGPLCRPTGPDTRGMKYIGDSHGGRQRARQNRPA